MQLVFLTANCKIDWAKSGKWPEGSHGSATEKEEVFRKSDKILGESIFRVFFFFLNYKITKILDQHFWRRKNIECWKKVMKKLHYVEEIERVGKNHGYN